MTHAVDGPRRLAGAARVLAGQQWTLAGLAAALGVAAVLMPQREVGLGLLSAATVFAALALIVALVGRLPAGDVQADTPETLLEADPEPVVLADASGRITHRNPAARQRFGPLEGGPTLAGLLGHDLEGDVAELTRGLAMAAGRTGAAGMRAPARRGALHLAVHRLPGGRFLWRLRDTEPGEAVAETAAEGAMLTASAGGTVLYMNEPMRRLLGGRIADLAGIFGETSPEDGETCRIATPDGPREMAVHLRRSASGRQDIRLSAVGEAPDAAAAGPGFDDLPVAVMLVGPEGEVLRANRQARELLGGSLPAVPFETLFTGLGRPVEDWLADAREGRTLRRPEVMRLRSAARETFLQVTLDSAGQPPGTLFAVLQDATELKTLEAQVVQSQKMQAIGQLAGGIAHDFNNLLTAISGHCDLLLLHRDSDDPDFGDLQQIAQNANRAAGLVSQLLAFSRKQTQQPEWLDLGDTVAEMAHLLGRLVGERVTLSISQEPELGAVRADRRQIEQVLMNLVVNARDAMPDGGEIRISVAPMALDAPRPQGRFTVPAGRYVELRVTDGGAGIPPEHRDKIFEPFFTTKRPGEGTGLGLSTAYGIVKQTGGFIEADNAPGGGAVFTVLLPAREAQPAGLAGGGAGDALAARVTGSVLLVEDEAPVRAFAARALRLQGLKVIEADCGERALELLNDAGLAVDLFVTDVIMPGLDGPSWVRTALRERPQTRVIFVSGYAEEALEQDPALREHARFLSKPFSLAELAAAVRAELAAAGRAG